MARGGRPVKKIEFFVPLRTINDTTLQEQKTGVNKKTRKPYKYDTDAIKNLRQDYIAWFGPYAPEEPLTGPVALTVVWQYPREDNYQMEPKTSRPDTDNMVKLLKDQMTKLRFWEDDAQVYREQLVKVYADPSGIYVKVEEE